MRKKILSIIFSLCMVLMIMPTKAFADDTISTYYRDYATGNMVQVKAKPLTIDYTDPMHSELTAGWYIVNEDITIDADDFCLVMRGEVHLILGDGHTLTVSGSDSNILVDGDLTIYGQEQGTGKLSVTETINRPALENTGSITINGGNVIVENVELGIDLSIKETNIITINGGNVTATGRGNSYSVGIGRSLADTSKGTITINGGVVNATGSSGYGINASREGTVSTGTDGHAVIFTNGIPDYHSRDSWNGIVFIGTQGKVYGSTVTLKDNVTIPEGYILVIREDQKLVVPEGVTLTNNGTIYVDGAFEGTADNLYYPLKITGIENVGWDFSTSLPGVNYNGKIYGKAGEQFLFRGFAALGERQYRVFTVKTDETTKEVISRSSQHSITMPYAGTNINVELKRFLPLSFGLNGGELEEGSLKRSEEDLKADPASPLQGYLYPEKANREDPYILPTADQVTKPGYTFAGWYDNEELSGSPVTEIVDKGPFSTVYWAKWVPAVYTVTLNTNGGTINRGNVEEYTYGQGAVLPTNIHKPGYFFDGWYDNGACSGNPITEILATEMEEKTYWAKWTPRTYTVIFDTNGGNSISKKTDVIWDTKVLDGIANPIKDGWEFIGWKCSDKTVSATTTYSELVLDEEIPYVILSAQWKDTAAPTGEISIGENSWNTFLNNITFGLFFKDTQTVTITASDNSGETVKVEYLLSDKELNETELPSENFTEYNAAFSINPEHKYVIYAKMTDANGNVAYVNSDGIVLDATAPVISGIENGKTYCEAPTVTIKEDYLESVKINGANVTLDENNQFVLNPAEGTQTVVAKDKAGNETSVTVTVNDGHAYQWQSENGQYWNKCTTCGEETAKQAIPEVTIVSADKVCRTQDLTFSIEVPEGVSQVMGSFEFEHLGSSIMLVNENGVWKGTLSASNYLDAENKFDVTAGIITADGYGFVVRKHITIQNEHAGGTATCTHKAVCTTCGEEYGELAKHTLVKTDAKEATCTENGNIAYWTCSKCNKIFSDEECTNEISVADTVIKAKGHTLLKVDAKAASVAEKGNIEYWECTVDHERFLDEKGTKPVSLEETVVAKLKPSIIEGENQTVKAGEKKELSFRSNAEFADFIEVRIDGKTLDSKNYTAKEGSTIITLKADYVSSLSAGTHTIGIVSDGGIAETTFIVQAKSSVNTSDQTDLLLWGGIMLMSAGLIAVIQALRKYSSYNNM